MTHDRIEDEEYICMWCQGKFDFTQGTWPQRYYIGEENEDEFNPNSDINDRTREEFVCYDCLD